jgi:hypothetical protein
MPRSGKKLDPWHFRDILRARQGGCRVISVYEIGAHN